MHDIILINYISPYSFTNDDGEVMEGITIKYIISNEDEKGLAVAKESLSLEDFKMKLPKIGYYKRSLIMKPKGTDMIVKTGDLEFLAEHNLFPEKIKKMI